MNRPTVQELECFTAVAEELSFNKAAARLHMSQPPLSRHIIHLEQKLGTPLFSRNTRNVQLTATGKLLLDDARLVLQRIDYATETVRLAKTGRAQKLDIGMVGLLLRSESIALLRQFRLEQPQCQIRLHDMLTPELVQAVAQGDIDGAFILSSGNSLPAGISIFPWQRELFKVALPNDHVLAKHRSLSLARLKQERWIMASRKTAPTLHRKFLDSCTAQGFQPKIVQEAGRLLAVAAMVEVGEGIGLLPATASASYSKGITLLPLKPAFTMEHSFIYRPENTSVAFTALLHKMTTLKARQRKPMQ